VSARVGAWFFDDADDPRRDFGFPGRRTRMAKSALISLRPSLTVPRGFIRIAPRAGLSMPSLPDCATTLPRAMTVSIGPGQLRSLVRIRSAATGRGVIEPSSRSEAENAGRVIERRHLDRDDRFHALARMACRNHAVHVAVVNQRGRKWLSSVHRMEVARIEARRSVTALILCGNIIPGPRPRPQAWPAQAKDGMRRAMASSTCVPSWSSAGPPRHNRQWNGPSRGSRRGIVTADCFSLRALSRGRFRPAWVASLAHHTGREIHHLAEGR